MKSNPLALRENISLNHINVGLDIGGTLAKVALVISSKTFNDFKQMIAEKISDKFLNDFNSKILFI